MDFIFNLPNYIKDIIITSITGILLLSLIHIIIISIRHRRDSYRISILENENYRINKERSEKYDGFTIAKVVASATESVIVACDFEIVRGLDVISENGFITLSVLCGHKVPVPATKHYHVFSLTYGELSNIIDSALYCGRLVHNTVERFYFIRRCESGVIPSK